MTGCKEKDRLLTCEIKDKSDGIYMTQKIVTFYKNNILYKAEVSIDYKVNNNNLLKNVKKAAKESFKEYEIYDGIKFESQEKNLNYIYKLRIDILKVSNTVRESLGLLDSDIVKVEEKLKNKGYTCSYN